MASVEKNVGGGGMIVLGLDHGSKRGDEGYVGVVDGYVLEDFVDGVRALSLIFKLFISFGTAYD